MIGRVLEAVAGHVGAADAVLKTDETLTVAISPDQESRVTSLRSGSAGLRVSREGRIGYASGSGREDDLADLVGRAMTSAASGEELDLFFPAPAPVPDTVTRTPQAQAAGVPELLALARAMGDRLTRDNRRVEAWAERSAGSVRVGNSRGVLVGYDVSLAGVGAVVESIGVGSAPPCRVFSSGAALPTLADVERLVDEVDRRLEPKLTAWPAALPPRPMVCFGPRALATLLRPLRAALTGRWARWGRAPLRQRFGEVLFDPRVTLVDDPLAPGRPGTRPCDDDGVVSRRLPLVERGAVVTLLADLAVGARAGVPSTGHAWRTPNAPPAVGLTNLRLMPGMENRATLLTMMGRGVLIEDLDWGAGPNPVSGDFALRAPWAYLVESGLVRGRLEGCRLAGNVFEALRHVGGVGSDATWIGAAKLPTLLLGGLLVSRER